mmetsp:Transcript_48505/g.135558  ORF Transcript_48505/g.135558 Transcript_48505/m.135558 type:complete len:213 (+) Transcript_48505:206-844(+)
MARRHLAIASPRNPLPRTPLEGSPTCGLGYIMPWVLSRSAPPRRLRKSRAAFAPGGLATSQLKRFPLQKTIISHRPKTSTQRFVTDGFAMCRPMRTRLRIATLRSAVDRPILATPRLEVPRAQKLQRRPAPGSIAQRSVTTSEPQLVATSFSTWQSIWTRHQPREGEKLFTNRLRRWTGPRMTWRSFASGPPSSPRLEMVVVGSIVRLPSKT